MLLDFGQHCFGSIEVVQEFQVKYNLFCIFRCVLFTSKTDIKMHVQLTAYMHTTSRMPVTCHCKWLLGSLTTILVVKHDHRLGSGSLAYSIASGAIVNLRIDPPLPSSIPMLQTSYIASTKSSKLTLNACGSMAAVLR